VASELRSLLDSIQLATTARRQRIGLASLQTYQICQQMARDENNAALAVHVKEMRRLISVLRSAIIPSKRNPRNRKSEIGNQGKVKTMNEHETIDGAALLHAVQNLQAAIEAAFTPEERAAALAAGGGTDSAATVVYAADQRDVALEDFALDGAMESLHAMSAQIQAVIQQKMDAAYEKALEIYYVTEKLAREPEHAHMREEVEKMRRAHVAQYGREIPERE
jgi:hypothetical protein